MAPLPEVELRPLHRVAAQHPKVKAALPDAMRDLPIDEALAVARAYDALGW